MTHERAAGATEDHQSHSGEGQSHQSNDSAVNATTLMEFAKLFKDPLGEAIDAYSESKKRAPRYSLIHAVLAYGCVLLILFGLVLLAWWGKITSEVLTFALGLIIGIVSYHLRAIFPLKS